MRRFALTFAIFGIAQVVSAQPPTRAQIEEAIAHGSTGDTYGTETVGTVRPGNYLVILSGPMGRISGIAHQRAKAYKPFAVADVPADAAAPELTVGAYPATPSFENGEVIQAPLAEEVLLQPHGVTDAAVTRRPLRQEKEPKTWSNAMGAQYRGVEIHASFPLSVLHELPPGDIDVVILTDGDELRYTLPEAKRKRIE